MMGKKATRQRLIISALIGAVLLIPACGGGGGSVTGPGTSNLEVTGTATNLVDTVTGQEILCISFTVTGIPDQAFTLAFEYQDNTLPTPAFATMSEITSATEALFMVTSESSITFAAGTGTVSASFYWAAGTDLGFVGSSNLTLRVTQPVELRLAAGPAFCVLLLTFRVQLLADTGGCLFDSLHHRPSPSDRCSLGHCQLCNHVV